MSSREGYQQSGDFDESGVFGENDEFENISPKIKKWSEREVFTDVRAWILKYCPVCVSIPG